MAADDNSIWPFFELVIRTSRLELRTLGDHEVMDLARVVADYGVHGPDEMPFSTPWALAPSPEVERSTFTLHMKYRAELSPDNWHLAFGVLLDGVLIGCQFLQAEDFAASKQVSTGSWLGRNQQGKGYGKEMRAAVLRFAFDCLGAERAETVANHDNVASLAVSRGLGYVDNGDQIDVVEGKGILAHRFVMSQEAYQDSPVRKYEVSFEGVEPCLKMLGAS